MDFVTYLWAILCATCCHDVLATDHQNEEHVVKFPERIHAEDVDFLSSSWFMDGGIERPSNINRWYRNVNYLRDIPEDSPIKLNYTIQFLDDGIFSSNWVDISDGSVFLCDKTENAQDASVLGLVKEIFGIYGSCPVSGGGWRRGAGVRLPPRNLVFNKDISKSEIRILIDMTEDDSPTAEKLFTATLRIRFP